LPVGQPPTLSERLKWLGERRDGFLVGGAVLYGLGYSVWVYNAWRNNLGQLPALDFQYLIAGAIPAFLILLAWMAIAYFATIQSRVVDYVEHHPLVRWGILALAVVVQVAISVGGLVTEKGGRQTGLTKEELFKYTAPLFCAVGYLVLLGGATARRGKFDHNSAAMRIYRYGVPLAFCWYSLVIFFDLYPRLPQALGGPEPKCAYADLLRDELSPRSLTALASSNPPGAAGAANVPKVVRSRRLRVYFAGHDSLLVRAATAGNAQNGLQTPLYELRSEVIRSVEWCE